MPGLRQSTRHRAVSAWVITVVGGLLLAVLPGLAQPSVAAGQPTDQTGVTAATTAYASATAAAATTLSGLSVSGDPASSIQTVLSTTRGTLTFPDHSGLTLAYGYAWSGTQSVGFTGSTTDINAALATVQLVGDGSRGGADLSITAFTPKPGLAYSASTSHYYEYVVAKNITWDNARAAAKARTFEGQSGYLATIPDQQVNDLLASKVQGATQAWFGGMGTNATDRTAAVQRTWSWADGPLAGQVFTQCSNLVGNCTFLPTNAYTSWNGVEPNNNANHETAAIINYGNVGKWNDYPVNNSVTGYLVEYGDQVNGSSSDSAATASATSTVQMVDAPGTVSDLHAAPGDGTATVTFAAPVDDGGSAVTGYEIKVGDADWTSIGTDTSHVVDGLTNGTPVTIAVRAVNGLTHGAADSVEVTPVAAPGQVTDLSVTPGDSQATVTFSAPASDGGSAVTGYQIKVGDSDWTSIGTDTSHVVDGLTNGTPVTIAVRAVNAVGAGEADSVQVTPQSAVTVPGEVTDLSVTPGDGRATVTFSAPASDGGSAVTGYQIKVGDGDWTSVGTDTSHVVDGLTDGTPVTIAVRAVNAVGAGNAVSAQVTPVAPPIKVTAPTNGVVLASGPTRLAGLSVTDTTGSPSVQVVLSTTRGTLTIPDHDGLTLAYGYAWSGSQSVGFSGSAADVNRALSSAQLVGAGSRGDTAEVSITAFTPKTGLSYSPASGHYYEFVPASGITWDNARAAAKLRTFDGQAGYLATIPNQDVDDLLASKVEGASRAWFGGMVTNATNPAAAVQRTWSWADGPRAGDVFTQCTNLNGDCKFVSSNVYTRWNGTEPNNTGGRETNTVINYGKPGKWNDYPPNQGSVTGYLVEYGDRLDGSSTPPSGSASATSTVTLVDAPGRVSNLSVTPGNGQATVTFAAPANDGGSPVTGYQVKVGDADWAPIGSGTTYTATGLEGGKTVTIAVRAVSLVGPGAALSRDVTPVQQTVPGAVTHLVGTPGDGSVSATWEPPTDDGHSPITGYQIKGTDDGSWDDVGNQLSAGVDGPENGLPFKLFVRAVNAIGPGEASSVTITPAGKPGAPASASVTAGDGRVTVTFTAPDDNGAEITKYVVTATAGKKTVTTQCTGSPCEVTGLTNGTAYAVRVAAVNSAGTGAAADAGTVTPLATPPAPSGPTLMAGDRQFTVTWSPDIVAPSTGKFRDWQVGFVDNGGTYRWYNVTPTSVGDQLQTVVTGVFNGRDYAVKVRRYYKGGPGPESLASNVTLASWFSDPLTSQERAALVDVPAKPATYTGDLARTKAYAAASTGAAAMALDDLLGRQLQTGQAVSLPTADLFQPGTFTLTDQGKAAALKLITDLKYVGSITCEGYVDYGTGATAKASTNLSAERARIFCSALKNNGYQGGYAKTGLGDTRPAIIGGTTTDRTYNNRLVVRIVTN